MEFEKALYEIERRWGRLEETYVPGWQNPDANPVWKALMIDEARYGFVLDHVYDLCERAHDFKSFLRLVRGDKWLRAQSTVWTALSELNGWGPAYPDDVKKCVVEAEGGSVKIGDAAGTCGFLVPNGFGDGRFPLFVCPHKYLDEVRGWAGTFKASVEGRFRIYAQDWQELGRKDPPEVADGEMIVEGRYLIYSRDGIVVLVEM